MIYLNDHPPAHVHVRAGDKRATIIVTPIIRVRKSEGFSKAELREIVFQLADNFDLVMERWNSIYGRQSSH